MCVYMMKAQGGTNKHIIKYTIPMYPSGTVISNPSTGLPRSDPVNSPK